MPNPFYNHTNGIPVTQSRGASAAIRTELDGVAAGFDGVSTANASQTAALAAQAAAQTAATNLKANIDSQTFTGTLALPATTSIGTVSATELAFVDGVTSAIQTQIDTKAPLISPALTGTPTAPTATAGNNTTQLATTAFVAATAFSPALPGQSGNAGKLVTTNGTAASWTDIKTVGGTALVGTGDVGFKTINSATLVGAGNIFIASIVQPLARRAFITASTTHTIPAGVTSARVYAVGNGGTAVQSTSSGGGGGMAYGDIAVIAGDVLTVNIAAGVATVIKGGVTMLTANPASGVTAGTASKDAAVTNGGNFSGGAGAGNGSGGASSGSPLGVGVASVATGGSASGPGGSGWGSNGNNGVSGGGVGSAGNGLTFPSFEPLLAGLDNVQPPSTLAVAVSAGFPGMPGAGGSMVTSAIPGGIGGFGGGGGGTGTSTGGKGGFGGGGGGTGTSGGTGGNGGHGGGGGCSQTATLGASSGAAVLIYY